VKKFSIFYGKFSENLERAAEGLGSVILGASAVMIFIEVVTRYLFSKTYGFLEEGPRLFLCFAVLPMLGVLFKRGRHIYVEIVPNWLTGRPKTILMVFIDVMMIVGSFIFLLAGASGTQVLFASGMRVVGVLDIPQYILMVSIPLGACILLLYSLESLVRHMTLLVSRSASN
jgi:TRAP-type C4-dicarboxylate transport system permease small subunit